MLGKLGIVALLAVSAAACTPGEYKGRVIAGLDGNGNLAAVLGTCDSDELVKLDIFEDRPRDSTASLPVPQWFAKAEHADSSSPMRVELPRDQAPRGWSGETWQLPAQGRVVVYAETLLKRNRQVSQHLASATIDMGALPSLPGNAEELATADC